MYITILFFIESALIRQVSHLMILIHLLILPDCQVRSHDQWVKHKGLLISVKFNTRSINHIHRGEINGE